MLILVVGLLALAVPAAGAMTVASGTVTKVAPGIGGPHTKFRFSFRTPAATGVASGWSRADTLSVGGPKQSGCVSQADMSLPRSQAGTMVRVTLNPSHLGGRWCTGSFAGEVIESQRIICGPPLVYACPQLVSAPQVISRFRFRVTANG